MKFLILTVGKGKFPFFQQAVEHYQKNISHSAEIEILELKDMDSLIEKEADAMMAALEKRKILGDGKNRLLVLDERGKKYTSEKFSKEIEKWGDEGVNRIVFVIGGAFGVHQKLKEKAHAMLSLSDFTFPHDLARVLLLEQVYRALQIQAGSKYHHA